MDTIVAIETVEVNAKKIRKASTGSITLKWQRSALLQSNADNLAELLEQESGVFIKSYGLNSLATSSIRGGSAGHTVVLWNGFPIQSPTLGLLDLSLLSTDLNEEISLEKGGNTANWGSGAIGGLIHLDNSPDKTSNNLGIRTKFGAFGEWKQSLNFKFNKNKFQSSTKLSHHQATNDFRYIPAPGLEKRTQLNAAFSLQNLLQSFYWTPSPKQQLALHYWWQRSEREIPPTNVQNFSEAYQNDFAHRIALDWQNNGDRHLTNFKVGFFREDLDYYDPLIVLEALSHFTNVFSEASNQWTLDSLSKVSLGFAYTHNRANTEGYRDGVQENRIAIFTNYQLQLNKLKLNLGMRQEWVQNERTPMAPSLALDYNWFSFFKVKAKVSKNYRLPTLNDRFWKPGGNEDLKAENGWSQELSFLFSKISDQHIFQFNLTAFNRNINNWILWTIRPGDQFWSANNIAEVWSRGLEPRFNYTYYKNKFQLKLGLGYDYIRSTNQIALELPRIDKGEQLLYTPEHQAFARLHLTFAKTQLIYRHYYTGKSQGINEAIDAYQTADFDLRYQFRLDRNAFQLFFSLNNLWDQTYFVIERRPMPGRYWQAGVNWNLR